MWKRCPRDIRCELGRRTTVNCRSSVETAKMMSKPGVDFGPGQVRRAPADWSRDIRHRGSVILVRALVWNCGNLRKRCKGKGSSHKGEADSTNALSRDGAARSSGDIAVMAVERRGCVIELDSMANRASGRSLR